MWAYKEYGTNKIWDHHSVMKAPKSVCYWVPWDRQSMVRVLMHLFFPRHHLYLDPVRIDHQQMMELDQSHLMVNHLMVNRQYLLLWLEWNQQEHHLQQVKDHQVVPLLDQLLQGQHHLVGKRGEGIACQELLKGICNSSNASQTD